jgi:hypothetical protein
MGRESHIGIHKRQNDVNRPANDIVCPHLIVVTERFGRERLNAFIDTASYVQNSSLRGREKRTQYTAD